MTDGFIHAVVSCVSGRTFVMLPSAYYSCRWCYGGVAVCVMFVVVVVVVVAISVDNDVAVVVILVCFTIPGC